MDQSVDDFPIPHRSTRRELRIENFFKERANEASAIQARPCKPVFLCFTQRTGSNLSAELLASTGKVPIAKGFFNWRYVLGLAEAENLKSLEAVCARLIEQESKNGVFASKMTWGQLYLLQKSQILPRIFPNAQFVYLRRRDVLDQAISYVIARQSGIWHSKKDFEAAKTTYEAPEIKARMRLIKESNDYLEKFFAHFGIEPFEVVFEDFVQDKAGTVSAVTEWLGLGPSSIKEEETGYRPQRSPEYAEWRARFLAERAATVSARKARRSVR